MNQKEEVKESVGKERSISRIAKGVEEEEEEWAEGVGGDWCGRE